MSNKHSHSAADNLPLRSATDVDLASFNVLLNPDIEGGKPVEDIRRLFHKQVIVDDQTTLDVETIKVPGFIGIADEQLVIDPKKNTVFGHSDIVEFLDKYGLLICTFQYNKDRYGTAIDLRRPPSDGEEKSNLVEIFIKNEGHHSGAIVPAVRYGGVKAFASFNEPTEYHNGMYGDNGYVAVAQRLVFPEFVTQEQARGYTDSTICWMALINPVVTFALNDFNGGDPVRVCDRATLKEFLKNCVLANLGSNEAIEFLNRPENTIYCSEFIYANLNTLVYPFNKQGLTLLLDGNEELVMQILQLQEQQNSRRKNNLSDETRNPQFRVFNIQMPVVPFDLLPLDVLMTNNGQTIDPKSIPFPPFKLSQVLRRAFHTLLNRQQAVNDIKLAQAQAQLFGYLEPLILKQLRLDTPPVPAKVPNAEDNPVPNQSLEPRNSPDTTEVTTPSNSTVPNEVKVAAVRQFIAFVQEQVQRKFDSYEEFSLIVDTIMEKADQLVDADGLTYFVPPRIYIDLGQNDGDHNLPKGWGFRLETIGALIYRGAIKGTGSISQPIPDLLSN